MKGKWQVLSDKWRAMEVGSPSYQHLPLLRENHLPRVDAANVLGGHTASAVNDKKPATATETFEFSVSVALSLGKRVRASVPIITANWKAPDGEQWTVPLGGGGGKIFNIGKQAMNASAQVFRYVESPTNGPDDWLIRVQLQFLFPKKRK